MRRLVPVLAAVLCLGATSAHAESTVALLVESSAGNAELVRSLEAAIDTGGVRVVSHEETAAAARFYGMTLPLADQAADELRIGTGVDRLITLRVLPEDRTLSMRFTDPNGSDFRSAAASPATLVPTARRLLRSGPPMPKHFVKNEPGEMSPVLRAAIAQPRPARAATSYGLGGTLEIGLSGGFFSETQEVDFGGSTAHGDATDLAVSPFIAYFPVRALQLSAATSFRYRVSDTGTDEEEISGATTTAGLALLVRAGDRVRVGPHVRGSFAFSRETYRYYYFVDEIGNDRVNVRGTRLDAGASLKAPLGASALLTVEASYFADLTGFHLQRRTEDSDLSGSFDGTSRTSGGEILLGFSFWTRGRR